MSNTCTSHSENLDCFAKFIYTDKDAVLIAKSNDFGTSLYIGDELDNLDGYYIRAQDVFVKSRYMNVKYDRDDKSMTISFLESDDIEECDVYDTAEEDDGFEDDGGEEEEDEGSIMN